MASSSLEAGVPRRDVASPTTMAAYVIRPDRLGEPRHAFQLERVPVPEPGPNEVLVKVMAAGVNYNGVWAALGQPISVFRFHGEPLHIAGSEAAGVVFSVGSEVRNWSCGDEVVVNPTQSCGQCPECNGLDPMACREQKAWGYETSGGCFAEFTCVQSQQLLPKPGQLTWSEAAGSGAIFIVFRMLVSRAHLRAGQNVLVWGASGGLGSMAVQLCAVSGANAIAVVSSEEKAALCRRLGAEGVIDRTEFDLEGTATPTPSPAERMAEIKRFGARIREITGGADPDIVFEHVGAATFPTSLYVCKPFGVIVTCGATSGYRLEVDARHLWMKQKTIVGSHICNAYEASEANRLLLERKVHPVVTRVFPFDSLPEAHQLMRENRHLGKPSFLVGADESGEGRG
jgi:crotonyl-CoA carboxylase/reductase